MTNYAASTGHLTHKRPPACPPNEGVGATQKSYRGLLQGAQGSAAVATGEIMMINTTGKFRASVVLGLAVAFTAVPGVASASAVADAPSQAAEVPDGYWRPMTTPQDAAVAKEADQARAAAPRTVGPCPAGTTAYTGAAAPYSCIEVYLDGSGHQVGLRTGQLGTSAFGLLHAQVDHNGEAQTIEAAVQMNAAGIVQPNDRRLYGAEFIEDGEAVIEFEMIEDRKASSASPDGYALGVVTAYCRVGLSGPESVCPQWVNDSL